MKKAFVTGYPAYNLIAGFLLVFLLLIPNSDNGKIYGSQGNSLAPVELTVHFSTEELSFDKFGEYDMVKLDDAGFLSVQGEPMLPAKEFRIALPEGMIAQTVRIISSKLEEIPGKYNILPSQPPQKINQSNNFVFINPVQDIYSSDNPYPARILELVSQIDLAGQSMSVLKVCPVKYIPAEKKLYLYTSITFSIEGNNGNVCGDYLPQNISRKAYDTYERTLMEMVVNKEAVSLTNSPQGNLKDAHLEGGPFEHVIITSDSYASYYQPLINWHIKKGVRDTVITTTYIYSNYSGADNQEKIRNFVIDAHSNWNTQYILIGGEHSTVPFEYRTYEDESIPSDQYYGDFDDDWIYEVYIGRVTASSSTQINCFINKVLKYEIDPPLTNYSLDACLLGMDLTLASEPPYYTLTRSEYLKNSIKNSYIPAQFDVTTVYDTETDNHKTKFINALNDGQNLVNHSDHSNYNLMGTGDRNHNSFIYISDVNNLTNTGYLSNIFSLGCHPLEMDHNDCIGEYFVIYNDLQAGVSFTGNTRSGWFYLGDASTLSGTLDLYWWRGLFDYNQYRLGETLAWTKNNCSHSNDIWKYCQWTLNLLGEPEMPLWTDTIKGMVVTHSENFPITSTTFEVHVEDSTGNPLESAFVCLWKGDEIYERDYTDLNGDFSLAINPSSLGNMYVTVTLQNFLPYEGTSECAGNLPPVAGFTFVPPEPTRHDTIQFTSTSYDNDGSIISWQWNFGDDSTESGEEVTHRYENYAEYIVRLIIEDDGGAKDTIQTAVAVTAICGDIDDNGLGPFVSDLTYFVDYIFKSGPPPPVLSVADLDGYDGINVADLTYLVDYLFKSGPEPVCE